MNRTPSRPARRPRVTRPGVRRAERISTFLITVGGIGTILIVSLIFVFLAWVIAPLFRGAGLEPGESLVAEDLKGAPPLELGLDVHGAQLWGLTEDGIFEVRELSTGESIATHRPGAASLGAPTSATVGPARRDFSLGFDDGTLLWGELDFKDRFLSERRTAALDPEFAALEIGERAPFEKGMLERTPTGALRTTVLEVDASAAVQPHGEVPVVLADVSTSPAGKVFALLTQDARLSLGRVRERENMLTGEVTITTSATDLPFEARPGAGWPEHLLLAGLGNRVFLLWPDGTTQHYQVDGAGEPSLVETIQLLPEGREVTAFAPVLGKNTFVVGDDGGGLTAWFATTSSEAGSTWRLVRAHQLPRVQVGEPTALASSPRSRTVAVGTSAGAVVLRQVTTEEALGSAESFLESPGGQAQPIVSLVFDDREEHIVVSDAQGAIGRLSSELRHPEANLSALFRPVWYEGYDRPEHVWQSTGGSNEFEPKLGLTAVVFGTIKATVYSMMFGAPLALLAAIFTSEYLRGQTRASIKSTLELMASLPSVVLGFLAATLVAPFVQDRLASVLIWFGLLPLLLLTGAYLWQMMPRQRALRWSGLPRLFAVVLTLAFSFVAARWLGPLFERLLFAGDMEAWLGGRVGSPLGGWAVLSLPIAALVTTILFGRVVSPRIRRSNSNREHAAQARIELLKFIGGIATVLAIAGGMALVLGGALGLDPRGSIVGAYDQRNALVVGFVMGFAIVPIIYTLSEDALTSVPGHLREASLGTGATPWQTATRVVLPIAASGIFSALMIGLGRAVGETMIVLMATGGTAILDWNVFNGFRTLSANIATELPEAVAGGTHYRVLFFAGFLLFLMTFALNTLAELVRQRFRKRAYQL